MPSSTETVDLASRARGLVNAILRRALREQLDLELALQSAPDAIRLSHPEFLIRRWQEQFGRDAMIALCEANNRPAEVYVRANGLKVTAGELARSVTGAELVEFSPECRPHAAAATLLAARRTLLRAGSEHSHLVRSR